MAKKSMIQRELKRQACVAKYKNVRSQLLEAAQSAVTLEERYQIMKKIEELPRDSSATRLHNRCWRTGRPRGYFRDFGLSRHVLREMAHECMLPGVTKSSW